jgi:Xaa-Pro aminopeptidase
MKRGLVSWDKSELPPEELAARLAAVHAVVHNKGVDAFVLYSDVWRSNDARYLSNYMPYWNRAFIVVPRDEKPILLCALSPRVYPWIKTVTVHETIIASPSPPARLFKLATERGWKRVGVCDLEGLPADLHAELTGGWPVGPPGKLELVDIARREIRAAPSEVEVQMHARAARMAREVLEKELSAGVGQTTDHELTGRLERLLRRAGAEDVVILVSNGQGPPLPASGAAVGPHTSVVVAIEYNGHWAKVTRNVAGVTSNLLAGGGATQLREILSGPYSWESVDDAVTAAVVSLQLAIPAQNQHLYYGDTCLQGKAGLRIL